jgi:hypothetical protein
MDGWEMNRLEKLKNKAIEEQFSTYNSIVENSIGREACENGWNAASAEYEKIIAELEGALEWIDNWNNWQLQPSINNKCKEALQKLREFRECK